MPMRKLFPAILLVVVGSLMYWIMSTQKAAFGLDWKESFYPAASLLLHGQNPYFQRSVFAPVWVIAMLTPFALLPWPAGLPLMFALNFGILVYVLHRFKAKPIFMLLILLSPMGYLYLYLGNIDSFALLGLVVPPPYSFLLLATKPQLGLMTGIYQVYVLWRERGLLRTFLLCLPAGTAILVNLLLIYLSPPRSNVMAAGWNISPFPWAVPIGIGLLYFAWKKGRQEWAIVSSPFFSPYIQFHSWIILFFAAINNLYLTFGIIVLSWVWILIHH